MKKENSMRKTADSAKNWKKWKKRKAVYLKNKERNKQEILNIYTEYDGRPGYRMMVIF